MDWEKFERIGIALCLTALLVNVGLYIHRLHAVEETEPGFEVILTIRKNGEVVLVKHGDLLLKNFAIILVDYFRGSAGGLSVKDINGNEKSFYEVEYGYSRIAIGTGSGGPTPGDYKLASKVATMGISSHTILKSGTAMNLTVSAIFSIDASYSITECGIEVKEDGGYWILITRDVFSAIDVSSGDVLTVTYTFIMNKG